MLHSILQKKNSDDDEDDQDTLGRMRTKKESFAWSQTNNTIKREADGWMVLFRLIVWESS